MFRKAIQPEKPSNTAMPYYMGLEFKSRNFMAHYESCVGGPMTLQLNLGPSGSQPCFSSSFSNYSHEVFGSN